MLAFYIFSLVLGGGLLSVSAFGGDGDSDAHAELGADDVGGMETDVESGELDHGHAGLRILSLRTLTYFLFAFGGTGAGLTWFSGASPLAASLVATAAGVVAAVTSAAVFDYLRRTESGRVEGESGFVGLTGQVVVPLGVGGLGKIQVLRGDRSVHLIARPFSAADAAPEQWRAVVVVEMSGGTALVAPVDEALIGGG